MRLTIAVFCLLSAGVADATADRTYEAGASTLTTNVNVSTGVTAIRMDPSRPTQRFAIEIFNTDDTDTIYCGFDTAVSSSTNAGTVGRPILKETGMVWQIQHNTDIFCVAADGAGASGALSVITQFGVKK